MTKRPDFCVIEVSHRCMFGCKMCNYWKTENSPDEVSVNDLRIFISSLKSFVGMPFEMNISGGEPLLKKGMLDLVEFIAMQGFRFSLVTNAYLIDRAMAKMIADSGLNFLAISLDSIDESIHDSLRGVKGSYRKVMQALEYFSSYRGRLQNITLQTIIAGPNIDTILDLVHWGHDRNISFSFMAIVRPNMVPMDSEWHKREGLRFLWPQDFSKTKRIIDTLIDLKKTGHRIDNPIGQLERFKLYFEDPERFVKETPCSLGDGIIHVNPQGDVYLCCEMDSIGNIKKKDIAETWNSSKAKNIREKIRLCKRNCAGIVNCYRGDSLINESI